MGLETLRTSVVAATVAGGLLWAVAVTADEIADGVALLPGVVEDVRVAGTWANGSRSGIYRVVIARSGGNAVTARVFVQWVAYHTDGTATLEHSMEITEFAELEVDVVDYISESDPDGLSVYIQADTPDAGGGDTYELFVFGPNDYLFGLATN